MQNRPGAVSASEKAHSFSGRAANMNPPTKIGSESYKTMMKAMTKASLGATASNHTFAIQVTGIERSLTGLRNSNDRIGLQEINKTISSIKRGLGELSAQQTKVYKPRLDELEEKMKELNIQHQSLMKNISLLIEEKDKILKDITDQFSKDQNISDDNREKLKKITDSIDEHNNSLTKLENNYSLVNYDLSMLAKETQKTLQAAKVQAFVSTPSKPE